MEISRPKKLLSVGIPSNRTLDASRDSVQSAVNFCGKSNIQLVISDNSQDVLKEVELRNLIHGESLHYIKSPPCGMIENWFNAFNATEGEFVLVMGDDDTIFRFTENPAFNNLPGDVVGIKPCVFAYAGHRGILNMNASPIQAAKASDRISENLQSSSGSNLGIFSFWRRSVFQSLMELWFLHHPTRGTYCDWALMNGLVSSGKVVVDPSACYFYNLQNWAGDTEAILRQVEWAFTSSGLPKGSSAYARLFNAIDSYIFVGRKDSPLSPHERKTASMFCLEFYLKDFITNLPRQTAHENAKEILQLSERLAGNHSVTSIFERISDVCSAIRPGLGVEYKDFCGFATGKPWGAC